jgi:hypothetical protein
MPIPFVRNNFKHIEMKLILILILGYIMISCESQNSDSSVDCFKPNLTDTVFIDYDPININKVNTKYDDYNAYVGYSITMNHLLIFSTNRNSRGNNFDITSYNLVLTSDYSRYDTSTYQYYINEDSKFYKILPDINTNYNEYGPYLQLIDFTPENYYPGYDSLMLFVTREENGNMDILYKKYSHKTYDSDYIALENKFRNSSIINSDYDDAYVSISSDFNKLFFCSNREGDFDIYKLNSNDNANIYNVLYNNSTYQLENVHLLNSDKEDKCPFINWNIMVFASNRDGGFGGYDLYYSKLLDNKWSEPINFGDKINTEFDEYRPVSIDNNVMIFSSNRPCGKGGFDLYIVRITNIK